MANQTDKFNTGTVRVNGGPVTNWATNGFNFIDHDGRVLNNVDIDGNNQARYTRTLTQEDIGQFRVGAAYTGGRSTNLKSSFGGNVGGSTKSNSPNVTQIVAGPGIYISAPDGRGVVTVSTQPLGTEITTDDLYDIQWTISDDGDFKKGTDLSQFTAGGDAGLALRSRDGISFTDMSAKIPAAGGGFLAFGSTTSLQSSEFDDNGVIYFCPQDVTFEDGGTQYDRIRVTWGRLGYTNTTGIYKGDGFSQRSSGVLENGSDITGEDVNNARCFYKSGSFDNALFVMTSYTGALWSTQGLPFDFYDDFTSDGTADPKTWRRELDSATGIFHQMASNLADNTFSSYKICIGDSLGKIWYSNRTSANTSTWTSVSVGSSSVWGIAYGNGKWVAAGYSNKIWTSTNGTSWTLNETAWPGTNWKNVAYGNGKFVVVGTDGHVVFSTDDGATWTRAVSGTKEGLNAIAYSPTLNKFVAVGNKRAIVTVNG
jgi:hypothetical protein